MRFAAAFKVARRVVDSASDGWVKGGEVTGEQIMAEGGAVDRAVVPLPGVAVATILPQ